MTWGVSDPYVQLDDRVAVDAHEIAIVASHGDGASVWLKGASGNQGIYIARPFRDVIRALDEARRPQYPGVPAPAAPETTTGGAPDPADEPPTP